MALECVRIFKALAVQQWVVFPPIRTSFSAHSFGVFRFVILTFNVAFRQSRLSFLSGLWIVSWLLIVGNLVTKFVYFPFLFQLDPINVINRLSEMGFFNILLGRSSRLNICGVLTKK